MPDRWLEGEIYESPASFASSCRFNVVLWHFFSGSGIPTGTAMADVLSLFAFSPGVALSGASWYRQEPIVIWKVEPVDFMLPFACAERSKLSTSSGYTHGRRRSLSDA